jgi:hypothetical protein
MPFTPLDKTGNEDSGSTNGKIEAMLKELYERTASLAPAPAPAPEPAPEPAPAPAPAPEPVPAPLAVEDKVEAEIVSAPADVDEDDNN